VAHGEGDRRDNSIPPETTDNDLHASSNAADAIFPKMRGAPTMISTMRKERNAMDDLHRALVRAAAHDPEHPFVIEAETGRVLTYRHCLAAVDAVRDALGAPPKRIALSLSGGATNAVVWLGALTGGHLLVPLASDAMSTEKARVSQRYAPDVLAVEDDEAARDFASGSASVMTRSDWDAIIAGAGPHERPSLRPAAGRVAFSTSGTTGEPKGVMLEASQIAWTADQVRLSHRMTTQDRGLTVLPFSHVNAPVVSLCASLMAGSTVVVARHFSRSHFWEWIEQYEITWASIVPTILALLLDTEKPAFLPGALRFVRTASAPLPAARLRAFEARFGVPVIETYGLTEAASMILANPVPPGHHKPGSVGLPVGVEMRICQPLAGEADAPLSDVASGETGEVCVRGPGIIAEYRGGVDQRSFADGWFRTGDLGYQDEDGYLYLTGRLREMINRGGEKIAPREVEEVLLNHPAVRDAVVVGRPDSRYGEVPVAYVVAEATGPVEEFIACLYRHASAQLSHYKVPVDVKTVATLPRSPNGKINRRALSRQEAGGDQSPH
jgi:acyl-CoA synthetase (AMP-forming)/AMP-acid ligase II